MKIKYERKQNEPTTAIITVDIGGRQQVFEQANQGAQLDALENVGKLDQWIE